MKSDRVRSWRETLNPSAPPVSNTDFVIARALLLGMAAIGIYYGFQGAHMSADGQWSSAELTSAVRSATDDLDGDSTYSPYEDEAAELSAGYAVTIEDAIAEHTGSHAPRSAIDATPTGSGASNESHYTITADGTDASFCIRVKALRDKSGDYEAPSIAGGSSTQRKYVFRVTSAEGEC
ncbi:hypothetical protein [Streptomyces camelliae]|uniref:Uncharacterized protein n=1 Tax=Streptomyces camelliae TaxID=3004093 RepID=A0ABY7P5F3_9ACTN|nr:hypothetical protein [Streptomyces sp. HUAS 2-6]WBO63483.1 hypothetical protein O1G22_11920 [Streptomyces sp. HUAS 2-6]